MTPEFRRIDCLSFRHIKKRGYPHLPARGLRPTTALQADGQSDTHVGVCLCYRKCAMKAWLAFMHTPGSI